MSDDRPPATTSHDRFVGAGLVALSALCFSTKAVVVKCAYPYGVDADTLLALRMGLALPIFAALAWRAERSAAIVLDVRTYGACVGMGVLGYYLSSLLDFHGLAHVGVGVERMVLYLYPTLVVLLSVWFLGQRLSALVVLALVATYIGIALTCIGQPTSSPDLALGVSLVAGCAVTYALFIVGSGRLMQRMGSLRFMSLAMSGACVAMLLHFTLAHPLADLIQPPPVYVFGVLLALVGTVVPSLLMGEGLKRVGAQRFAIISTIGPVGTVALAWLVLGEAPGPLAQLGMVVTIVAGMAMGLSKTKG